MSYFYGTVAEMRKTDRLFALAELLRARRTGITAKALAERFGVTVRTIYRDLESLRTAAVPVIGERGRGGGLTLDQSYSLPPVNFTAREAAILVAVGRGLERTRLIPFVETLRSAIDKVQGALPTRRQREVLRVVSTLAWVGVPARSVSAKVRAAVELAWVQDVPLRITYDGTRGSTERTVRIKGVVIERTMTLLNCVDLEINSERQFRLHQIRRAQVAGPADLW